MLISFKNESIVNLDRVLFINLYKDEIRFTFKTGYCTWSFNDNTEKENVFNKLICMHTTKISASNYQEL